MDPNSNSSTFPSQMTYVSQFIVNPNNKQASGFWNDLNKAQYDALQKFKEMIMKNQLIEDFSRYDDLYLLRFLRARKFDLDKTMAMFQNFLKWRKANGVDDIIENFQFTEIFDVKKIYPHGYHKTDKTGRPIYIELLCKVNLVNLFKVTSEDRMMKYYVKEYERLMKYRFPSCSQAFGSLIEQSLTILDVEGLGVSSLVGKTKQFMKIASDIGQDYYPEMLGTMFLINTGFFFNAVWTIVKGFIDPKTRNKIKLEGSGYKKKLLELVDAENLPDFLGGSCTCPEIEGGCLYADIGPWNPKGGIVVVNTTTSTKEEESPETEKKDV